MLCETATKSQQQKDMDVGEVKKFYLEKKSIIYHVHMKIIEQIGCMKRASQDDSNKSVRFKNMHGSISDSNR